MSEKKPKRPTTDQPAPTRRDFLATMSMGLAYTATFGLPLPALADSRFEPAPAGAAISKLAVFPPIGISRVGGSDAYFLTPEVPGRIPDPPGGFKDAQQRIKKQVQQFRVYGLDDRGRVVREITADEAQIRWTVHVANTKAAWYGFNNPLDLGPQAPGIPAQMRNAFIVGDEIRARRLIIDPGPRSIEGANVNQGGGDERYVLEDTFWDEQTRVRLGELRTDPKGRLRVFPADGTSDSVVGDNAIEDFTKNDAWYDDWCDGWVKASVTLGGQPFEASPGWIACCGPDFAPGVPPLTSLYDTIHQAMLDKYAGTEDPPVRKPERLSWAKDIYPIFHRLGMMQWVSAAAANRQGWVRVGNFSDPAYIRELSDPSPENERLRRHVFEQFRRKPPCAEDESPEEDPRCREEIEKMQYRLPYMLGSGVDFAGGAEYWFLLTDYQVWVLEQWARGNYDDWETFESLHTVSAELEDLPVEDQAEALIRAPLQACSGGNYHPGVELTWVLGRPELFAEPYRIELGNRPSLVQDLGRLITPENAIPPEDVPPGERDKYPIGPQMPGDLTRWMGLPWQPDAFSCQSVELANDFPTLVWWPALLPVDVLPEASWRQVLRADLSRAERLRFAGNRVPWARGVAGIGYHANGSYFDGLNRMVYLWEHMGFVVQKRTPVELTEGPDALPEFLYVEVGRGSMDLETDEQPNLGLPHEA